MGKCYGRTSATLPTRPPNKLKKKPSVLFSVSTAPGVAIPFTKSQGLTFDKATSDAGDAFASGQVYVALSRCRSLEGMVLLSRINPYSIENDKQIVEHERNKIPIEELEYQLNESRNQFRSFILQQLFDFRTGIGHISRLKRDVETVTSSFNDETMPLPE